MVLLVMGILTAVAAPRLASQLNVHSVGSVRTLIETDLQAAQQEAIATSSPVTFTISKSTHHYSVTVVRNGTETSIRTVTLDGSPWNCRITSLLRGSSRAAVDSASVVVNGAGVFADDLEITISSGTSAGSVAIQSATGRILVE